MTAVPPVASPSSRASRHLHAIDDGDWSKRRPTPSADLPDAAMLVRNLAIGVVEVLHGARDVEQIARWLDEDVYRNLLRRALLASRGRAARRQRAGRPVVRIGATRVTSPADGVVEAVVVVHGAARTRAVAIRLEGLDSRWRATAVHVL